MATNLPSTLQPTLQSFLQSPLPSHVAALALAFSWAFCPSTGHAQTSTQACPAPDVILASGLSALGQWADACEDSAQYHAHRGALLLALGQTEAAAVSLEKALLLNPELAGAQLDYAQALAQIGMKGSARAILSGVLQRPDIQPQLKTQLSVVENEKASVSADLPSNLNSFNPNQSPWRLSALAQTAYGRESNLNGATYTDALTLYLSNGPVTVALADNAKPQPGMAFRTTLAGQALYKGANSQELWVSAALGTRRGATSAEESLGAGNQTIEGALKYSLPMLAGDYSGVWQLGASATQFRLGLQGGQPAYEDRGVQLKYAWDSLGARCKWAPLVGSLVQQFPQSTSLNGTYKFARMELACSHAGKGLLSGGQNNGHQQETYLSFGGGQDNAQNTIAASGQTTGQTTGQSGSTNNARPGGNRSRLDVLVRHEQVVSAEVLGKTIAGQLTAWLRLAKSRDQQVYSELLGDLKTSTLRQDAGLAFWWPVAQNWSAGLNLEATSQRSNNALFNLKNSALYLGLRWAKD